jgi:hypothetical protein
MNVPVIPFYSASASPGDDNGSSAGNGCHRTPCPYAPYTLHLYEFFLSPGALCYPLFTRVRRSNFLEGLCLSNEGCRTFSRDGARKSIVGASLHEGGKGGGLERKRSGADSPNTMPPQQSYPGRCNTR